MSRLEESLRPLAARLLARAGSTMTWRRAGPPAYDPDTGEVAAGDAGLTVVGVIDEVTESDADGLVRRGDRTVTLAAEPLADAPAPGDAMIVGGAVHRVIAVDATWAGDRPVLFRLHLRR